MNKFTLRIKNKGYDVNDFCEYWGISYKTYNRYVNNHNKHDKLSKMINGMNNNEQTHTTSNEMAER